MKYAVGRRLQIPPPTILPTGDPYARQKQAGRFVLLKNDYYNK
jgi:hypothetical protein